ncbi:MAG: hypothetical protein HFH41_13805 [Lachnospiraceae bacterium]|nr:hypothetical protein [Lachnospiraceae bacterium]
MKELLREKGLGPASVLCFLAMAAAFPFYQIELPLNSGSFIKYFQDALSSQIVLFVIPIGAVLPLGAVYVRESSSGFLKSYLTRTSRMAYVKKRTLQIYASGFLPFFYGGISGCFLCFLFLYPLELQGNIPWEVIRETFFLLLRICLTGGILAEISGIFAALFQNYYMAYGLPFVCYYMLIILKDRYFPDMYAMYPAEWIFCKENWGREGMGIWLFFLAFSMMVLLLHSLLLYWRLREI